MPYRGLDTKVLSYSEFLMPLTSLSIDFIFCIFSAVSQQVTDMLLMSLLSLAAVDKLMCVRTADTESSVLKVCMFRSRYRCSIYLCFPFFCFHQPCFTVTVS